MIAARLTFWLQSLLGVAPAPAPAKPIQWPRSDPSACANTCPQPRAIRKGIPVCWGFDPRWESLPIINVPADALRVKRRLRHGEFASVVVKTPRGVQRGILRVTEESLEAATTLTVLWKAVNVTYP